MSQQAIALQEVLRALECIHGSPAGAADQKTMSEPNRVVQQDFELVASAVLTASDGVVLVTPPQAGSPPRIVFTNDAFCRMLKMHANELVGADVGTIHFTPVDVGDLSLVDLLSRPEAFSCEGLTATNDGELFSAEVKGTPVLNDHAAVTHWALYVRDIRDSKARLLELERRAQYDPLTELPNRVLLFDRLEQAVLSHVRNQKRVAVMILDVDDFKDVNDGYGHHIGDILLKQIAARLRAGVRRSDTVARLGGDEFAVVLPQVTNARAAQQVARKLLRAFEKPLDVEGRMMSIRLSVGMALCPDHGTTESELLRHADLAMYCAKRSGVPISLYDRDQERDSAARIELAAELKTAIDARQIFLCYQPEIDSRTGRILRVEALARWNHPRLGFVPPEQFIAIAETTGLIQGLTALVIETALQDCAAWMAAGLTFGVSINLSPRNLAESSLPEMIARTLARCDVPPQQLQVEITESSLLDESDRAMALISTMRQTGISIAMDDFGTGYSSLSNLRMFPFDEIKIDRSFVKDITKNESDAAIVRATIDLAHSLGARVVAEGVEDAETLSTLVAASCDAAQGFFISPPVPFDEVLLMGEHILSR